jgi:hypothetical protein
LKNSFLASKRQNLGDRKCLGDPRKSLIGHPDAISFSRISGFGLFQQPQAITLKTPPGEIDDECNGNLSSTMPVGLISASEATDKVPSNKKDHQNHEYCHTEGGRLILRSVIAFQQLNNPGPG